jgi:oligo-1,6-glucosidase
LNKKWWKESVVYQIYPRSFMDSNGDGIGDLKGITSKMDYLQDLGVDVIWLSPVYQSPNDDNGYDIADYRAILPDFGSIEDFDELLVEAHHRGLKIMMDLVVNHSSDEHSWFLESRSSKDNSKRDYYIWKKGKDGKEPTNWESFFTGSAWEYDETTNEYYLHLFSKKQPDLNWENPKLRKEVYDLMTWWLDKGIDGFRMDVINMISKDQRYPDGKIPERKKYGDGTPYFFNGPRIHEFLQEMNQNVLSKYDIITVGETPGVTPEEAKLYTGSHRHELNMIFQFEHMDIDNGPEGKWSLRPWKLTDLKRILSYWQTELEEDGWNSLYWDNHDQPRAVSRFGNDSEEYWKVSAQMLATCLHMMKGTPYIYQGEELGMTNVAFSSIDQYKDIETLNAYDEYVHQKGMDEREFMNSIYAHGRDNARTPFQWNDSEHAGFTTGTPWMEVNPNYKRINAEQQTLDSNSVFHYYKKLIKVRKKNEVIIYGRYEEILKDHDRIFAYTRTYGDEKLLVVCNFTHDQPIFHLPAYLTEKDKQLLIANYPVYENDSIQNFVLRPYEARVYKI